MIGNIPEETKKIYLMQHGLALAEGEDPERPLSVEGKVQIEASARAIRSMGLRFGSIVTSEKKRARQTAEIVAGVLGYPLSTMVITASVNPSVSPEAMVEDLRPLLAANPSLFVVGHLPSLPRLVSYLLCGKGEVSLQFENGGLVCIVGEGLPDKGSGSLRFCLTAQHLRSMVPP